MHYKTHETWNIINAWYGEFNLLTARDLINFNFSEFVSIQVTQIPHVIDSIPWVRCASGNVWCNILDADRWCEIVGTIFGA